MTVEQSRAIDCEKFINDKLDQISPYPHPAEGQVARKWNLKAWTNFPIERELPRIGVYPIKSCELPQAFWDSMDPPSGSMLVMLKEITQELKDGTVCGELGSLETIDDPGPVEATRRWAVTIASIAAHWFEKHKSPAASPSPKRQKARDLTHLKDGAIAFIEDHGGKLTEAVYQNWVTSLAEKACYSIKEGVDYPTFHTFHHWWSHSGKS